MRPFFETILLVDDDFATNHYHEIILEEWGVSKAIYMVSNGQQALEFLKTQPQQGKPSLILLDINMPVMNGFEFLEEYERLDESQKVSFVIFMLTSSLHPNDVQRAGKFKALNGYCEKPMTEEVLKTIVDKIQASYNAYAEAEASLSV